MRIESDGYTARANPRRGYYDRELVLKFASDEDEHYKKGAVDALVQYLVPRNMWVRASHEGDVARVNYGYDSGD